MDCNTEAELQLILSHYPLGCPKPLSYPSDYPEDCHIDPNNLMSMALRAYRLSKANILDRQNILFALPRDAYHRDLSLNGRQQATNEIRFELLKYMGLQDHFKSILDTQD
jgi:hypothetical protein